MILTPLLTVVLATLAPFANAQLLDSYGDIRYDAEHNSTSIVGTWSSQSNAVITGPDFVDPTSLYFKYPKNTGHSYSFTADGYFEVSRYFFHSNGTLPTCIRGVIVWFHGKYTLNANGSITLTPFEDGFQQVQDPCGAVSNFIETYKEPEYMTGWRIFNDVTQGPKLHLFQFDGAPVAPLFQRFNPPMMHPTRTLRNESWIRVNSEKNKRSFDDDLVKRSSSPLSRPSDHAGALVAVSSLVMLAFSSLLL